MKNPVHRLILAITMAASLIFLAGCEERTDYEGFSKACIDSLYLGEVSPSAPIGGEMKAAIDSTYTRTLNDMTMVFLKYIGLPVPCDSSVQLVQDLLKNMIAKATFDLSDADENGNITVRVHPVTVLVDLAQDLDDYYYDFYLRNNSLEFSELSDEQFEKTYLDQVITMFETQLIGADTPTTVTVNISVTGSQPENMTIDADALKQLMIASIKGFDLLDEEPYPQVSRLEQINFECSGYVKAYLDALYLANFSDLPQYVDISESELEDAYISALYYESWVFLSYLGFEQPDSLEDEENSVISQELLTEAALLINDIYQCAKYEVGPADSKGNLSVTVTPIDIYNACDAQIQQLYESMDPSVNSEMASLDDEAFISDYVLNAIDIFRSHLEQVPYSDPVTIPVQISIDQDGLFGMPDDVLEEIDYTIINYDLNDTNIS